MFNNIDDHGIYEDGAGRRLPGHDDEGHFPNTVEYRGATSGSMNFTSSCTRDGRSGCLLNNNTVLHPQLSCSDIISNPSDIDEYDAYGSSPNAVGDQSYARPREHDEGLRRRNQWPSSLPRAGLKDAYTNGRSSSVQSPQIGTMRDHDAPWGGKASSFAAGWESKYCSGSPHPATTKYSASSPGHDCFSDESGHETDYDHPNANYHAGYVGNDVAENWSSDGEESEGDFWGTPTIAQSPGCRAGAAGVVRQSSEGRLSGSKGNRADSVLSNSQAHSGRKALDRATAHGDVCFSYDSNAVQQMGDTRGKAGAQGHGLDNRAREDNLQVKTTSQRNNKKHQHGTQRAPKSPYRQQSAGDIFDLRSGGASHQERRRDDLYASTSGNLMASRESFFATRDSIFGYA